MLILVLLGSCILSQVARAQSVAANSAFFHKELSRFGTWAVSPSYGEIWIPVADPGFIPYATAGHWAFTDGGWRWVSDYPWGWAPFHYGRWDHDRALGWFWVPGDEWAPAWVSWRSAPGYYGWAPLAPGVSILAASGKDFQERSERWTFVRCMDMARGDVSRRYVDRIRNVTIIRHSTVIMNSRKDDRRNLIYVAGPDRNDVQRVTRELLRTVVFEDNDQLSSSTIAEKGR